jgi:hypothetical protein
MAKAQRVLTERELSEQLRLGIKKELLAYIHNAIPRSQKIDDLIELWKQVNTELQMMCADRKRQMRFLELLPKEQRTKEIKRLQRQMLPESTQ